MASVAQEWWDGGIQEGIQKGRQEGRQEGIAKGIEQVAIKMIDNGMSLVDVSKNTGLTMKALLLLCKKKSI